jgi:hypothetical protein
MDEKGRTTGKKNSVLLKSSLSELTGKSNLSMQLPLVVVTIIEYL